MAIVLEEKDQVKLKYLTAKMTTSANGEVDLCQVIEIILMRMIDAVLSSSSRPSWLTSYQGTCCPAHRGTGGICMFPYGNFDHEGYEVNLGPTLPGLLVCAIGQVHREHYLGIGL